MEVALRLTRNDALSKYDPGTQKKILRNTLDRLTRAVNKDFKNRIVKKYNIKKKDLKTQITRTTQSSMVTSISARKSPYSLTRFNPKESMTGMTVQVLQGQTSFIEGAFLRQPIGNKYKSRGQKNKVTLKPPGDIFVRKGNSAYPIDALGPKKEFSFSLGQVLGSPENLRAINAFMNRERANIEQEVISGLVGKAIKKIQD